MNSDYSLTNESIMNKPVDFASKVLTREPTEPSKMRLIGQVLRTFRHLSAEQVEKILELQRAKGLRFGEAAIKLNLVSNSDVVYALSQQYSYPYRLEARDKISPELITAIEPFSKQAEVFRAIRYQILTRSFNDQVQRQPLAVISPSSADGRSFFAGNLAISFSQLGAKVLLVDADLRSPRQHEIFKIKNAEGLSSLLSGRTKELVPVAIDDFPSLYVMPAGPVPPNPLELVERADLSQLLREWSEKFDYIIVDTPAASHGADALALAHKCGLALCVAREGKTKRNGLIDLMESLSSGAVRHVGAILNRY